MRDIMNERLRYVNGNETYKNKFINPVIMEALSASMQAVEEVSVIRSVLDCTNAYNVHLGTLTVIWGIRYAEPFIMAYEPNYDSYLTEQEGINGTSHCKNLEIFDARNDEEAAKLGILKYKAYMEEYWKERFSERP